MKDLLSKLPYELENWLSEIESSESTKKKEIIPHKLSYILSQHSLGFGHYLSIEVALQRQLKNGSYGKVKVVQIDKNDALKYADDTDRPIIAEFRLNNNYDLSLLEKDLLLKKIIKTKKCYLDKSLNIPATLGSTIKGSFEWLIDDNGEQKLELISDVKDIQVGLIESVWYVSKENNCIGKLETNLSLAVVKSLLKAPKISPSQSGALNKAISKKLPKLKKLKPKKLVIGKKVQASFIKPIIEFNHTETLSKANWFSDPLPSRKPTVSIFMEYDGHKINVLNTSAAINILNGNEVTTIKRDKKKEKTYIDNLYEIIDIEPFYDYSSLTVLDSKQKERWFLYDMIEAEDDNDYFSFKSKIIALLEPLGWQVEFASEEYEDILELDDSQWYSGFESSDNDFFKLQLGIEIDNHKIDIMPTIISILNDYDPQEILNAADDETLVAKLETGARVLMPLSRIKPMIKTIMALFNIKKLKPNQELTISIAQAQLMYEMEQAYESCKLRWHGTKELSELGRKLSKLKSIKKIKPAKEFKATLRDYQQDGLNWLQFLREYHLAGILADDMGLGKTVQALAHLAVEKEQKRLTKPCLIVAPTSLMTNWQQETEKFAPHLKTLTFHGENRHKYSDKFNEVDLVFTTYDLITRDKEMFLKYDFYYVILDEAQRIKNSKAKSTQIILQLKTKHRLCLTGTPLENHLGELWSLFHFLMPGFLSDQRTFTQIYRTPIEKHSNIETKKNLGKRLKPFLLRRLKSEVVKELPDKTEIIRYVELKDQQRDIYESIRLTMESKIKKAIEKKGVSRSHIEILEALLRLRQTCCDPKLLKLDNTKQCNSQKLDDLFTLVDTLIDEGRNILLFSQFTSMLKIIEDKLKERSITYVKLTGQTKDRKTVIEKFQNGEAKLFLISLKAGGVGLNLTQADTVIHYDPWWNPAVEDQATDRSHRIGQSKAVFVYKFIAKGTVEETILKMQQKKRELMTGLFDEKAGSKLSLSKDDISNLFKPIDA